jgi:YVTN family beta-propeller protein
VAKLLETIAKRSDHDRKEILPNHLGISGDFVVKHIAVGANPRAVAYTADGRLAYVANALDDTVTVIDTSDYTVTQTLKLGGPSEINQIRWGEKLFHDADITFGQQFSCRSCHPDGHINGLTIDIEADGVGFHPVDNRSLRGILDTGPFKWEGTNPSLHRQCGPRLAVFFTRLAPYTPEELSALVRYMCTIELPPNGNRSPAGLTLSQRRGKALFERTTMTDGTMLKPEERCVHCHSGAYKTSRTTTPVASTMWFDAAVGVELTESNLFDADEFGEMGTYYFIDAGMPSAEFDVPHLRNVYDSPPYMHNGIATSLEEIWTRYNMVNRHGMIPDLTRQQLNDLIAYLKAL